MEKEAFPGAGLLKGNCFRNSILTAVFGAENVGVHVDPNADMC
jgi:hypothetical protein